MSLRSAQSEQNGSQSRRERRHGAAELLEPVLVELAAEHDRDQCVGQLPPAIVDRNGEALHAAGEITVVDRSGELAYTLVAIMFRSQLDEDRLEELGAAMATLAPRLASILL